MLQFWTALRTLLTIHPGYLSLHRLRCMFGAYIFMLVIHLLFIPKHTSGAAFSTNILPKDSALHVSGPVGTYVSKAASGRDVCQSTKCLIDNTQYIPSRSPVRSARSVDLPSPISLPPSATALHCRLATSLDTLRTSKSRPSSSPKTAGLPSNLSRMQDRRR
jgi:hypothetical protein